jgi:hypothetical protein
MAQEKKRFYLSCIKCGIHYVGTFAEAIDQAKRLDEQYHSRYGVDINDEDGNNLANVEDGKVSIAEQE